MSKSNLALAAAALCVWAPACRGVVGDAVTPPSEPAKGDDPMLPGTPAENKCVPTDRLAESPLHRLTASEYDNPGTTHLLYGAPAQDNSAGKPRVERTTRVNMPVPELWPAARAYALATPTGYVLEAVVTTVDLDLTAWALQPNTRIGFNVGINASLRSAIAGSPNRRAGSYVLRTDPARVIPESFPFNTNVAFCTPTLR